MAVAAGFYPRGIWAATIDRDERTGDRVDSYNAGAEWNIRSSSTATSKAGALSAGAYFEVSLDSTSHASDQFLLDAGRVNPWRNGNEVDTHFKLAIDANKKGFAVDDLIDITASGAECSGNVISNQVRLYTLENRSPRGNVDLYNISVDSESAAPIQPNIILIFMDDLGYNDIGSFTYPNSPNQYPISGPTPNSGSSDPDIPEPNAAFGMTPRIDSLAKNGMQMTQFYASSRCSQSRASLMTGRYDARTGVTEVFWPNNSTGLNTTEVTIPELLRQEGYVTSMVGKWHLGYNPNKHNPYQMMPMRHGFHEFFGFPHSNDMSDLNLIRDEMIEEADFASAAEQAQITWRYTEASLDFIQRATGKDEPFFLYLAHSMTHRPTYPSAREYINADGSIWPKFQGTSGVSYYYDVVKEVDHSTGRILDKLNELGIDDNTLVIFTSDNGPWTRVSSLNLTSISVGSAYPLRDGKGTTWEGGCRVPFVAQWPRNIPAGTIASDISGLIDLLPTFVEMAGGTLPADRTIDGIDLTGLWLGESGWTNSRSAYALFGSSGTVEAILKGDYKLRSGKLYNLADDIQESADLSVSETEILADLEMESAIITASISAEQNTLGSFTAYEVELSTNDLSVPEGGTAVVEVKLSADPGKIVGVTLSHFTGDRDLSVVAGANLTFTSSDWNTAQTVTLAAAQDADAVHSGATFWVTTDDIDSVRKIFVFEVDDEAAPDVLAELVWPKGEVMAISNQAGKLVAEGAVTLDGTNNPSGSVLEWKKISGPGDVMFTDAENYETGVSFSSNGMYWIRFMADHPSARSFGSADFKIQVGVDTEVTVETSYQYSPVLVYDASKDFDEDAVWENLLDPGNRDWALDADITRTTVDPAPQLSFINAAYVFPGGSFPDGATSEDFDAYSTGDASFEFWIKPDSLPLNSPQVLWESGGNVGVSFVIDGSLLRFAVYENSGAVAEGILLPSGAQDGFLHCIGVIDLANNEIRLYLDGVLVDAASISGVADWCGTSQSGLGTVVHSDGTETSLMSHLGGNELLSGTYGTFAGQIAWVSFYDKVLTDVAILDLTSGPVATSTTNSISTYAGNIGPLVSAGSDQTLNYVIGIELDGIAHDDGLPSNSVVITSWRMVSGSGSASFADESLPASLLNFDRSGTYPLWLEADDGEIKVYDEVSITVDSLTYAEWVTQVDLSDDRDGADDNPDGDRFNNYWEWVLGQDPEVFDAPISMGEVVSSGGTNTVNFIFTFDIPRNRAPDLGLKISKDLINWTVVSNLVPKIEVLDGEFSRWTYELEVDTTGLSRLFARPEGML